MRKKPLLIISLFLLLFFLFFPVKGACGGKGRTCAYLDKDGKFCSSRQVKPNFASLLDISINYSDKNVCR